LWGILHPQCTGAQTLLKQGQADHWPHTHHTCKACLTVHVYIRFYAVPWSLSRATHYHHTSSTPWQHGTFLCFQVCPYRSSLPFTSSAQHKGVPIPNLDDTSFPLPSLFLLPSYLCCAWQGKSGSQGPDGTAHARLQKGPSPYRCPYKKIIINSVPERARVAQLMPDCKTAQAPAGLYANSYQQRTQTCQGGTAHARLQNGPSPCRSLCK